MIMKIILGILLVTLAAMAILGLYIFWFIALPDIIKDIKEKKNNK